MRARVTFEEVTLGLDDDMLVPGRNGHVPAAAALSHKPFRPQFAENRHRLAQAVSKMLSIASSGLPLEDALQDTVNLAGETMGSHAAGIYSVEERWDRPVLLAGCGALPRATAKGPCPIAPSILARAIALRGTLAVGDVRQEILAAGATTRSSEKKPACRALLVTPIQRKDRLWGYLVLFHGEPGMFCEDDHELANLFVQQVTLLLENADLRSQAEKTAIENERNRLARDLHDAVTQTLFSASVVAEALPRVWDRDPAEGRRALEELRLWTRGALAEMRTLLMELRPAALIEKPLPDLIRQLTEATTTRLRISAVSYVTARAEPPTEVKLSLYRIAQEALNNVAKHSGATGVEIHYRALPRAVQLAIIDDGRGFNFDSRAPGQMGLGIMRERAQHVGAKLSIQSAPGAGTQVRVEWKSRGRNALHE